MFRSISMHISVAVCVLFAASALSAGIISGTVTQSGGGAVAGAVVRTDGEPSYSTTTGSNGAYSLTLPTGVFAVLASAPGYNPQRMSLPSSAGIVNFALQTASTGRTVSLPAPLAWGEPPLAPMAPGDSYPVAFSSTSALPDPNAPRIADYSDCVKPNESFTMAGANFTTRTGADAGTDTTVWIWGRTSTTEGTLRQAKIWSVSVSTIVATIPDDIPFGMYLVWVENSVGVSAPICINRPKPLWVGPIDNKTYAGGTKRIFGRNLSYGHGTSQSYVYIQPASGGAFTQCDVTTAKVEPYAVEFTVPAGISNGNYKVFIHNGQGGQYGWGDALDLVVQTQWVRGSGQLSLTPNGTNDTTQIQNAINTVSGYANGGVVQLSSGNFIVNSQITIAANVELKGAGMNSTTVLLRGGAVKAGGSRAALTNLTLHEVYGYGLPAYEFNCDASCSGVVVSGVRIDSDQGDDNWKNLDASSWMGVGTEVGNCEMSRQIVSQWNCWFHDNILYGDVGPWYLSEGPAWLYGWNNVFEGNHVETKNWPIDANGYRNYKWWDYYYKVWAKRVVLAYCGASYIAHNTSKDVAVDDNRGEMILFHGHGGYWCGQVLSNNGLTMTVRTDGKVFDQAYTIPNAYDGPFAAGQPFADTWTWWAWDAGRHMAIIAGTGAGQMRLVAWNGGVTAPNQITVESPWAVQPDSTSVAIFTGAWSNNIVYANELNAFPVGFSFDPSMDYANTGYASVGVDFDGNSYHNVAEGNISRRTNYGRMMHSQASGPGMWNEMRDEQAIDCNSQGYRIMNWEANPLGPGMFGNAYRNCSGNVNGTSQWYAGMGQGEGSIFENMNLTGSIGYLVGSAGYGSTGTPTLYRNGSVTVNASPLTAVSVESSTTGGTLLVNNTYSGTTQPYSGVSAYARPVAVYRVARFATYAGYSAQDVLVPIANAGTAAMSWTVTASDAWITPAVQSNGTVSPEGTAGRLAIGVNTAGMTPGTYWGSVTVNTGAQSVKVGVRVSILAGSPPDTAPNAVFSATPTVGTAPRSVSFDAGASNDPDGSIVGYYWDFGDGSYGSGATVSHAYGQGTYTPVLTVTDDAGVTDQAWTNVAVSQTLTAVSLSGTPGAPLDAGTAVTLTASASGGYQTQYRFLVNSGSGWTPLGAYQSSGTTTWTPAAAGYYEVRAYAKASDSTNAYDKVSNTLSYPIGQIPASGIKLWLKADSGVTKGASGLVSAWTDQSSAANSVSQTNPAYQPTFVDSVINGRPAVRFGGGSQMLRAQGLVLSGTTNFTSFVVGRFNSPIPASTYQYFWWNGADNYNTGYGAYLNSNNPQRLDYSWGSKTSKVEYPYDVVPGTWYRISSRMSGSADPKTHQLWVNGSPIGQSSKSGSNLGGTGTFFSLGNFGPAQTKGFFGDIAEVLIYNRDLSESERTSVENYLAARWTAPVPIARDRIRDVLSLADEVLVSVTSAKVAIAPTGVYSDGGYYIEEPDRTCGIRVVGGPSARLWDNLTITGVTGTDAATGERILTVSTIDSQASGAALISLGMANKAFSSTGQLVRVWGKVTAKTGNYITIDDGSGSPVKAEIDGLNTVITKTVNIGDYISVTGPAGLISGGIPVVRPRSDSDIQAY